MSGIDPFEEALAIASTPWGDITPSAPPPPERPAVTKDGPITYYWNLVQGSDEWYAARCGLLTASEMKLIVTPTLKIASNDKERTHLYELLGQRITQHVEEHYISDDMLRGKEDEILARDLYSQHYAPVEGIGFMTNSRWGFTLGFSPDGFVGGSGFIEAKSRRQKYGVETIVEYVQEEKQPEDYMMQTQTGFLVSERKWCDFISYSGGLPMATIRIWPDAKVMNAIVEAAGAFEERLAKKLAKYNDVLKSKARLIPTKRREIVEMHV